MNEDQMKAVFLLAGIEIQQHWKLENEYWPDAYQELKKSSPWWLVKTEWGMIKIGWRKRVISIDWSGCDFKVDGGQLLEEGEQWITHWASGVHAYSYSKVIEYLSKLGSEVLHARWEKEEAAKTAAEHST